MFVVKEPQDLKNGALGVWISFASFGRYWRLYPKFYIHKKNPKFYFAISKIHQFVSENFPAD